MTKFGSFAIDLCQCAASMFVGAVALSAFAYLVWGSVANTPELLISIGDWMLLAGTLIGGIGLALCAIWVVLSVLAWAARRARLVIA
jgi:hypothetical protein